MHASALLAPGVDVLVSGGHATQLGLATLLLPPGENVPCLQSPQFGPP